VNHIRLLKIADINFDLMKNAFDLAIQIFFSSNKPIQIELDYDRENRTVEDLNYKEVSLIRSECDFNLKNVNIIIHYTFLQMKRMSLFSILERCIRFT